MRAPAMDSGIERGQALSPLVLGRDALGTFDQAVQREWLVTNGIGGFAAGTVGGVNTRRYHGLLIASLQPPVVRTVMVAKLDAAVRYAGISASLATNEYMDGTIDPHGHRYLYSFRLEGQYPVWTWAIGDALLEQRVWMAYGKNTTYVEYRLLRGSGSIEIELKQFCTYRDYHTHLRGYADLDVRASADGFAIVRISGEELYRVVLERGTYTLTREWYWNFKHREESLRGLDDVEDLFVPAFVHFRLSPGETAAIVLTAEAGGASPARVVLDAENVRQAELLAVADQAAAGAMRTAPSWIRQLILAADQFIVERAAGAGKLIGKTVIAGYPWFGDWGRDTMISLPGLTLATGRYDVAASILRTFAGFVSEGMLPNRFPDGGESPQHNTVDATLWYFVAADDYLRRTNDIRLRQDLYPTLKDIVVWHIRGTRYGIHVDPLDSLLFSGAPGVQLTWMDAKVNDWVVTPRTGKCVEINALWYNVLNIMREWAEQESDADSAQEYALLADRVAISFSERFWFESGGYLYDVIDVPGAASSVEVGGKDPSQRPNQLFAVSLPHPLLKGARARGGRRLRTGVMDSSRLAKSGGARCPLLPDLWRRSARTRRRISSGNRLELAAGAFCDRTPSRIWRCNRGAEFSSGD